MVRKVSSLFIIFALLFTFGCVFNEPAPEDQALIKIENLGLAMGMHFKSTQSPENVAKAQKYTKQILAGSDIMASQDLINDGIKLYLSMEPKAALYYLAFETIVSVFGIQIPTIDIAKQTGLDLSRFKPKYLKAFFESFQKGLA